jgi:succinyl-diaminopimelate desuccinylase
MLSRKSLKAELGRRLLASTLELVDIASESGAEGEIVEHVLAALGRCGVAVRDAGDTCVLAGVTSRRDRPLVLLVGHLDTVPAQDNWPGRVVHGSVVGLGASDMKGGVAVMLDLALTLAEASVDVGYVLFGREELPADRGALRPLLARESGLCEADLAIVLEPTANAVQAGCLGNLDATWTFAGTAGHSARPWLADNAIERAAEGVLSLGEVGRALRTVGGLQFAQVVSATTLQAGLARNVIPGEAVANVNFRYAPDVASEQAEAQLRAWCEPHGSVEVFSNTPGARPPEHNALADALVAASGQPMQPKQAWTPVADFAAAGVEAVNFGPGDPEQAHRADEHVAINALVDCRRVLESVLCA